MYIRNYIDCLLFCYFQTYSSSDNPATEWCSDSSPSMDIGLLTSNFNEQGSFVLEVKGVKPYDCKFIQIAATKPSFLYKVYFRFQYSRQSGINMKLMHFLQTTNTFTYTCVYIHVLDTILCDKVSNFRQVGWCFSLGSLVISMI